MKDIQKSGLLMFEGW